MEVQEPLRQYLQTLFLQLREDQPKEDALRQASSRDTILLNFLVSKCILKQRL